MELDAEKEKYSDLLERYTELQANLKSL